MSESAKLHSDLDALVGAVLHDRYEVQSLLGSGGMGAVFRARHTGLERDVAIKVLRPELGRDSSVAKRFEREATSASRLDHPNCVRVTDFGTTEDGTTYLVMELLEGSELEARLGRPWAPEAMIETAKQMLCGLEHAHHFGIIHRDLKPENVFLTTDFRGEELVKLVDFGIAKLLDEQGVEKLTRQGIVFGTPRYMAPEQAAGGKIDARSDLYAAGLIFYEMLAGRPPFEADEPAQLLRMQIMAPPPPLPESVPAALAGVVDKLLEKSKADRYASAREVIDALETAAASLAPGPRSGPSLALTPAPGSSNQPARSGVAWQPAAQPSAAVRTGATISTSQPEASMPSGAGSSIARGAPTHAYASSGHLGVGQLSTGAYDSLGASAAASPMPADLALAGSHAEVVVTSVMDLDGPPPERRLRVGLPIAIVAALLLVAAAVGGIASTLGGDDPAVAEAEATNQALADEAAPDEQSAAEPAGVVPGPVRPEPFDDRARGPRRGPRPTPEPDDAGGSGGSTTDDSDASTVDEDPREIDRRRKAEENQANEDKKQHKDRKKHEKKAKGKSKSKGKGKAKGEGKNSAPQ
ncbi:Serine/threonine-protein kinase PknB [Enhygromyxa salina]|uniref:non-specific serine/threonine protein kinase n=1 Tax=Enhygromyxa salina TaxID=215803 RepID=A0A2S9XLX4_9BACT|nr:serine/threonine-protein kinase [Enhygromyxa salina]PRP93852.1 Serine/threonine-protein kinase PknB [Enhygromyxa salina]